MHNEQILQQLRQGVEEAIDTKMRTPKDFDTLSERIYRKTHKRVSSSTLKRFWGYLSSVSVPRLSTLDILAQFIGYADYESFCHTCEEDHLVQEPDKEPVELPPTASDGDSLTFLGVYRLDLAHSDVHHLTWERVADAVDLNRLDNLEELRN